MCAGNKQLHSPIQIRSSKVVIYVLFHRCLLLVHYQGVLRKCISVTVNVVPNLSFETDLYIMYQPAHQHCELACKFRDNSPNNWSKAGSRGQ